MNKMIECASCAMKFCVPDRFETDRRNDHKTFYCPNGHSNWYSGKNDLEKANEKVARLKQDVAWYAGRNAELRDQLDHALSVGYGYKGAMRKYQREIGLVA